MTAAPAGSAGLPAAAVILGYAGLAVFVYGAVIVVSRATAWPTLGLFPPGPEGGLMILERFGAAVLAFMGGCLWGFASAPGRVPSLERLAAAAVPAVIAFLAIRPDPALSCLWLAFGFVVLQAIDIRFQRTGIAPAYWLSLRLPLSAGAITCLLAGALYG